MDRAHQSPARTGERSAFGGAPGAFALTLLMPAISIYLWICIHHAGGALLIPRSLADLVQLWGWVPWPTARAVFLLTSWVILQLLLQLYAPGRTVLGQPLSDGTRLSYRINGLSAFGASLGLLLALVLLGILPAGLIHEELGPLLATATFAAFGVGLFLYFYGKHSPRPERTTGQPLADFFLGTALNPRLGQLDIKMFFESRVGMLSWPVLNLAMAAAQYQQHGRVSSAMLLVVGFQLLYAADFFVFEEAMLTTWDILHENFGFMLVHASLVWIPFNFSLQAQYLVYHPHEIPSWAMVLITGFNLSGYYIFRSSNLQKHRFRTDPEALIWGRSPTYIQTARGTRLLTSGFWGLARHTNYLGDLMMALAWCLPCGFSHLVPYFYFIYFAPLLISRERRDHAACQAKYGADWDEYCRRVPWRIVPGIY